MKKILTLLALTFILASCGNAPVNEVVLTPEPSTDIVTITEIEIPKISKLYTDGLTIVSSTDCSLISNDSIETITLYTSAQKDNGRFIWDDHARWVLEISTENEESYILYDTEISNGSIYFDIVDVEGTKYILLRNISTASNYTKTFAFEDGKLYETEKLDLNKMKNSETNLIFTSTPNYR